MSEADGQFLRWAALAAGFALGMLVHEVIMEETFRLPGLPHSLSLWISLVELSFCALVPAMLEATSYFVGRSAPSLESDEPGSAHVGTSTSVLAFLQRWAPYAALSSMIFIGGTAGTQSGRYLDYSVKVVFKCSKLLPTMLSSTLLGNSKKFSGLEYIAALFLCVGTALFSMEEGPRKHSRLASPNLVVGVFFLSFSIAIDAFAPNLQQWLMREQGAGPDLVMKRTNGFAAVIALIVIPILGGVSELIEYARDVREVLACLVGLGTTLSFSIACQIRLIKAAGSVVTVGVATLRKSGTLLLSYLLFPGKAFGWMRGVGIALVALGLGLAEFKSIADKKAAKLQSDHSSAVASVASPVLRSVVQENSYQYSKVDPIAQVIGSHMDDTPKDAHSEGKDEVLV